MGLGGDGRLEMNTPVKLTMELGCIIFLTLVYYNFSWYVVLSNAVV